jgi:hypothetical protein
MDFNGAVVTKVPPSKTDGLGHLVWTLRGDIMDRFADDYKSSFKKSDYNKIIARKYGQYLVDIGLSLDNGSVTIINNVNFDNLKIEYSPTMVGTTTHREALKYSIKQLFRNELIESYLSYATQITGVSNRRNMKLSPDDQYTFVVIPNYYSGDEKMALIRVDNYKKTLTIIDSAMEVEYQDSRIRVRKHDTFLFFFDSHNDIYYNYRGIRIN